MSEGPRNRVDDEDPGPLFAAYDAAEAERTRLSIRQADEWADRALGHEQ